MQEQLALKEKAVIDLLFNGLDFLIQKLEEERKINHKSEFDQLEAAVKLCHQIRSLLPPQ